MGNSYLPIDNFTIGATAVGSDEMVFGVSNLGISGSDTEVETSDGKLHYVRVNKNRSFSAELFLDRTDLETARGGAVAVVLKLGTTTIDSFNAVIVADYDDQRKTTNLQFSINS